jgi:hypothetical protein
MKPSEALRAARDKISTPDKWTKGCYARRSDGVMVPDRDPKAVRFCMIGAVCSLYEGGVVPPGPLEFLRTAIGLKNGCFGGGSISDWNDDQARYHGEVVDAFRRAIAIAESEGR